MKIGRILLVILGALMIVFGAIWALQGMNIITSGSMMVGHRKWILIGGIIALAGIVLIILASTRRKAR